MDSFGNASQIKLLLLARVSCENSDFNITVSCSWRRNRQAPNWWEKLPADNDQYDSTWILIFDHPWASKFAAPVRCVLCIAYIDLLLRDSWAVSKPPGLAGFCTRRDSPNVAATERSFTYLRICPKQWTAKRASVMHISGTTAHDQPLPRLRW